MGGGFYVREQKYICGKNYATAPTMQAEFFEVSEKEHKASTRRKKELATSLAKEVYNLRKSGRYLVLLVNTTNTIRLPMTLPGLTGISLMQSRSCTAFAINRASSVQSGS